MNNKCAKHKGNIRKTMAPMLPITVFRVSPSAPIVALKYLLYIATAITGLVITASTMADSKVLAKPYIIHEKKQSATSLFENKMEELRVSLKLEKSQKIAWANFINARRNLLSKDTDKEKNLNKQEITTNNTKSSNSTTQNHLEYMRMRLDKIQYAVYAYEYLYSLVDSKQREILVKLHQLQ